MQERASFFSRLFMYWHKLGFTFVLVFTFLLVVLHTVGFTPELRENVKPVITASTAPTPDGVSLLDRAIARESEDTLPRRIVIESAGIDVNIIAPTSANIGVLDSALLKGAVLYPGSGNLDDVSNLFIFGHSSHLPTVRNQNFKAFNDLETVEVGETIRVESADRVNVYRVVSVEKVRAEDAVVAFSRDRKMLTLTTCNSFGSKDDRFMVRAEFVRSYELARPEGKTLTKS
jgi:LPXTG-site transpeptidase (sortase) family protein